MEDYMEDLKDVVEEPNQINPSEEINSEEEIKKTKEATAMVEYKEVDEPCVALTIIGENRLTDAEVFVRRGFRFSLKAFFIKTGTIIDDTIIKRITEEKYFESINPTARPLLATIRATSPRTIIPSPI